jgi:hypothetical protein
MGLTMPTDVFKRLDLPLGAYQFARFYQPMEENEQFKEPTVMVEFSAAIRRPFETERCLMLLDWYGLHRLEVVIETIRRNGNTDFDLLSSLGEIPFMKIEF